MNVYSSVPSQRSQATVSAMKPKTMDRKFQKTAPIMSERTRPWSPWSTPMKAMDSAPAVAYTSQATSQPQ